MIFEHKLKLSEIDLDDNDELLTARFYINSILDETDETQFAIGMIDVILEDKTHFTESYREYLADLLSSIDIKQI